MLCFRCAPACRARLSGWTCRRCDVRDLDSDAIGESGCAVACALLHRLHERQGELNKLPPYLQSSRMMLLPRSLWTLDPDFSTSSSVTSWGRRL
jgi:hypothetical protein